jgi:glycosyltransferase involved in cell wall biosynthesis
MKLSRLLKPDIDLFNTIRRYFGQKVDQFFAIIWKKIKPIKADKFEGDTRFALITVNFSTTYYLKLMLLTLCEQKDSDKVSKIIIVDNNSRDGGVDFIKKLSHAVDRIHLVQNKLICTHARGVRIGIDFLNKVEKDDQTKSNVLMVCDTDIIFLNPKTLTVLSTIFDANKTAFAGELRYSIKMGPQAQASFLCIRRDCYARADVRPFVNHGSPAFWMQRSLLKAGLFLHDFRSNFGGYILHRGRTGVKAANQHNKMSTFATTPNNEPHYTGVENGKQIWQKTEDRFAHLLKKGSEDLLLEYFNKKLNR